MDDAPIDEKLSCLYCERELKQDEANMICGDTNEALCDECFKILG
jgi:hypothetical protein